MAIEAKTGQNLKVTVTKKVTRESARKTLERLFMKDKAVAAPIQARTANFNDQPKRRGGRIWTKHPNKIHLDLQKGFSANIKATPQSLRDLNSVAGYVEVSTK